jgi:carboxypeptidase C (cathepsin A)
LPALLAVLAGAASAQEQRIAPPAATAEPKAGSRAGGQQGTGPGVSRRDAGRQAIRSLPADSRTQHRLQLASGSLAFTATAGKLVLQNDQGAADAEIAYVAYTLDGQEAASRPVTFAVNGGPGASSAWLHIGVLGPWRLAMTGQAALPSAGAALTVNPDSWLAFTDLVFIDPVGTGYSRMIARSPEAAPASAPAGGERRRGEGAGRAANPYWSVGGDIRSLSQFVGLWLGKFNRFRSPKLVVGESYGGFRGPKLAHELQTSRGIGINGLVLVSPVLDFAWISESGRNPLNWIVRLPSFAATVREGNGPVSLADVADVESYAKGDYLRDLMIGERDPAVVRRRSGRVADITGLDPALVLRLGGKVPGEVFRRERGRQFGRVASAYDATDMVVDPYPGAYRNRADSGLGSMIAPFTTAMLDLYASKLDWRPEGQYHLLNFAVSKSWNYGPGGRFGQEAVSDLREALALDPSLRVLVVHGLSDIVTPYFQSKLILDQLPPTLARDRVKFTAYGGGHMFYSRDASRAAFRADASALYTSVLDGRGK